MKRHTRFVVILFAIIVGTTATTVVAQQSQRPSTDALKPEQYTIGDKTPGVEVRTLTDQEHNEKVEQLRKEGLLTDKEAEALKKKDKPKR